MWKFLQMFRFSSNGENFLYFVIGVAEEKEFVLGRRVI
jgi:hypothetical protein